MRKNDQTIGKYQKSMIKQLILIKSFRLKAINDQKKKENYKSK